MLIGLHKEYGENDEIPLLCLSGPGPDDMETYDCMIEQLVGEYWEGLAD